MSDRPDIWKVIDEIRHSLAPLQEQRLRRAVREAVAARPAPSVSAPHPHAELLERAQRREKEHRGRAKSGAEFQKELQHRIELGDPDCVGTEERRRETEIRRRSSELTFTDATSDADLLADLVSALTEADERDELLTNAIQTHRAYIHNARNRWPSGEDGVQVTSGDKELWALVGLEDAPWSWRNRALKAEADNALLREQLEATKTAAAMEDLSNPIIQGLTEQVEALQKTLTAFAQRLHDHAPDWVGYPLPSDTLESLASKRAGTIEFLHGIAREMTAAALATTPEPPQHPDPEHGTCKKCGKPMFRRVGTDDAWHVFAADAHGGWEFVPDAPEPPSSPEPTCDLPPQTVAVLMDVAYERSRQIKQEGWTPDHDADHIAGELADAAAAYAMTPAARGNYGGNAGDAPEWWPWEERWWKPGDRSEQGWRVRELVKAGALIVAEIERLHRGTP